jgi:hypothetical protein
MEALILGALDRETALAKAVARAAPGARDRNRFPLKASYVSFRD